MGRTDEAANSTRNSRRSEMISHFWRGAVNSQTGTPSPCTRQQYQDTDVSENFFLCNLTTVRAFSFQSSVSNSDIIILLYQEQQ